MDLAKLLHGFPLAIRLKVELIKSLQVCTAPLNFWTVCEPS
jgi:hypothetical protein